MALHTGKVYANGQREGILCQQKTTRHDIIDGAPAARFVQRLKELIESGYGLDDSTVESEQTVASGTSRRN
jgi:hypothetical protein